MGKARLSGRIALSAPINLADTLKGGQTFRFRKIDDQPSFCGVYKGTLLELTEPGPSSEILYQVHGFSPGRFGELKAFRRFEMLQAEVERLIKEYLCIDLNVDELKTIVNAASNNVELHSPTAFHVRVLAQERFETLIAFITSANNNIERITKLLGKLCSTFGEEIYPLEFDDKGRFRLLDEGCPIFRSTHENFSHAFPTARRIWKLGGESPEKLSTTLREMGFGYRAKYIAKTVQILAEDEGHPFYADYDRNSLEEYEKCTTMLQTLQGVGKKVADCIALQGFQFGCAVPIDVHIRRISINEFRVAGFTKLKLDRALTGTDYRIIADFYRTTFGHHAGLVQQVMFVYSLHRSKASTHVALKPEKEAPKRKLAPTDAKDTLRRRTRRN
ncbi:unnamed protein product, partial [Mesorhabditis spiculigera]